ncbi:MAG: hypothetical protein MI923_06625 [Phycisphaerales bacterium]|nr:hypothetical protein [Phycisphaerales bacterium]
MLRQAPTSGPKRSPHDSAKLVFSSLGPVFARPIENSGQKKMKVAARARQITLMLAPA